MGHLFAHLPGLLADLLDLLPVLLTQSLLMASRPSCLGPGLFNLVGQVILFFGWAAFLTATLALLAKPLGGLSSLLGFLLGFLGGLFLLRLFGLSCGLLGFLGGSFQLLCCQFQILGSFVQFLLGFFFSPGFLCFGCFFCRLLQSLFGLLQIVLGTSFGCFILFLDLGNLVCQFLGFLGDVASLLSRILFLLCIVRLRRFSALLREVLGFLGGLAGFLFGLGGGLFFAIRSAFLLLCLGSLVRGLIQLFRGLV